MDQKSPNPLLFMVGKILVIFPVAMSQYDNDKKQLKRGKIYFDR